MKLFTILILTFSSLFAGAKKSKIKRAWTIQVLQNDKIHQYSAHIAGKKAKKFRISFHENKKVKRKFVSGKKFRQITWRLERISTNATFRRPASIKECSSYAKVSFKDLKKLFR